MLKNDDAKQQPIDSAESSRLLNLKRCSMPFKACGIATIPNPMNPNEILLFGGYWNTHVYIYNRIHDKFTQNKHDFSLIIDAHPQFAHAFLFPGMIKNTLIVTAVDLSSRSYYCIFNCQTYQWEEMDHKDTNNLHWKNKYCHTYDSGRRENRILSLGSNANKYKNYLITSKHFRINIFDVKNQYTRPKRIVEIFIRDDFTNTMSQRCHSSVIIDCINNNYNDNSKSTLTKLQLKSKTDVTTTQENKFESDKNCNEIEILFFGTKNTFFEKSFVKLYINFDEIIKLRNKIKSCIYFHNSDHVLTIEMSSKYDKIFSNDVNHINAALITIDLSYVDIDSIIDTNSAVNLVCSIEQHPPEWTTDSNINNVTHWLGQLFDYDINGDGYTADDENDINDINSAIKISFSDYQWYENRFLLIIGGLAQAGRIIQKPRQRVMLNTIICFDLKYKHWKIYNDYTIPQPLLGMSSAICLENNKHNAYVSLTNEESNGGEHRGIVGSNKLVLHTFGGCYKGSGFEKNAVYHHWVFNLCQNIDWNVERTIWIAYLKNASNSNQCKLTLLPKDIILYILLFLRNKLFFDSM